MMDAETVKAIAIAMSFASFMAIFCTYTVHARKVVCRTALTALAVSIVLYIGIDYGGMGVAITCAVLALAPMATAVVAWGVMNAMKASIERRYQASTGVTHTLKGTIAEVYQVVLASDHE